ncbi:MAG: recombinase [Ruminococcus sp.]|nr:recombinase [Ruminococcus sp.]
MHIGKTISIIIGKGSIGHNNREFIASNVDKSRTSENITLVCENLKDVYHEIFNEALSEYNAKQKRKDRVIKDYYEHIFHSKQEKAFYELVVQIGNKDDTPCGSDDGILAAQILEQFAKDFSIRNSHIRVFNSVIHLDEANPHLHIDFVPFATKQKRGLSTRNSLSKALEQQGFIAKGQFETSSKLWIDNEKQQLAEIMKQYDIEWKQLGTHNPHLTVLDYKKQERTKEITRLENKIECTDKLIHHREKLLSDVESVIDKLDSEYQEKQAAVKKADEEFSEKNAALTKIASVLADNHALLKSNSEKITKIKDIDSIETGKTVFSGKITISQKDYVNLTNLAKKQIAAESRESELSAEVELLKQNNSDLSNENVNLRKEIKAIKSLRESLSTAFREIEAWKKKYQKVIEFLERLGLKQQFEQFLKPQKQKIHR